MRSRNLKRRMTVRTDSCTSPLATEKLKSHSFGYHVGLRVKGLGLYTCLGFKVVMIFFMFRILCPCHMLQASVKRSERLIVKVQGVGFVG